MDGTARTPAQMIDDGLYFGRLENLEVDLRIDAGLCGIVSADIFSMESGKRQFIASLRTASDVWFDGSIGRGAITAEFPDGPDWGEIELLRAKPNRRHLVCILRFARHVAQPASPSGALAFEVSYQGTALRRLAIQIDAEQDQEPQAVFASSDEPSVASVYAGAGIEIIQARPGAAIVPPKNRRWSEKDLPRLMERYGGAPMREPDFRIQVLWLSESNRRGLLGVMFDTEDAYPRQGLAIFAGAIRGIEPQDAPPETLRQRLVHTTVHEIGHALNLAHRFEPEVAKIDSLSCMNYDWTYAGGGCAAAYWDRCRFTFDPDELDFLRHGPWRAVAPGGEPFHSVPYWAAPAPDDEMTAPAEDAGLALRLLPPGSPLLTFAQPVTLGIELHNVGSSEIVVPHYALDQKGGLLSVAISRIPRGRSIEPGLPAEIFAPIVRRCYRRAADPTAQISLRPGQARMDNINITFGVAGFPFAEPGDYMITARLTLPDPNRGAIACQAAPVKIRIARPHSAGEEAEGLVMLEREVGHFLAGFGSHTTHAKLRELLIRRTKRSKAADDGVAAHLARSLMFDAVRRDQQEVRGLALKVAKSINLFDPCTRRATDTFIKKLA
jgi:hypothetical protein